MLQNRQHYAGVSFNGNQICPQTATVITAWFVDFTIKLVNAMFDVIQTTTPESTAWPKKKKKEKKNGGMIWLQIHEIG